MKTQFCEALKRSQICNVCDVHDINVDGGSPLVKTGGVGSLNLSPIC